jgi:NAD(P)-dependent dehydrogenase (short-subunit alcohol dehydrogenase family)
MKRDKSLAWRSVDANTLRFDGLKVAVIGGTGGIGQAFSRLTARRGAKVLVVGQTFRDADQPNIEFVKADLSRMSEAKRVAELLPAETLDLVIFTTGIMAGPKREVTVEGIERDMAISFLSRLAILRQIAPRLGKDRLQTKNKPRVFVMGFPGTGQRGSVENLNAEKSYSRWATHMNTVAGNEMLVLDAARRYPNATFFGLNPGFISTNIRSNLFGGKGLFYRLIEGLTGLLAPSADAYARRIAPLFVSTDIEKHSGAMFESKGRALLPSDGLQSDHIERFLVASETLAARADNSDAANR